MVRVHPGHPHGKPPKAEERTIQVAGGQLHHLEVLPHSAHGSNEANLEQGADRPARRARPDARGRPPPWNLFWWGKQALEGMNFRDEDLERSFRVQYEVDIRAQFALSCSIGVLLGVPRVASALVFWHQGPENYSACCTSIWAVDGDNIELNTWALLFETLAPLTGLLLTFSPIWLLRCPAWRRGRHGNLRQEPQAKGDWFLAKWLVSRLLVQPKDRSQDSNAEAGLAFEMCLNLMAAFVAFCSVSGCMYGSPLFNPVLSQMVYVQLTFPVLMHFQLRHVIVSLVLTLLVSWPWILTFWARGTASTFYLGTHAFLCALMTVAGTLTARKEIRQRERFLAVRVEGDVDTKVGEMLLSMLPAQAVSQLKASLAESGIIEPFADGYEEASVLFIRLNLSEARVAGTAAVADIHRIFSVMDKVVEMHPDAYKVETVGPEYMISSGVPNTCHHHACALAELAQDIMQELKGAHWSAGGGGKRVPVSFQMGIHSGALVAGVAGLSVPRFRLFGDTVNMASRMKAQARAGEIILSDAAAKRLLRCSGHQGGEGCEPVHEHAHGEHGGGGECSLGKRLECLGKTMVKGKGEQIVWRLQPEERGLGDGLVRTLSARMCTLHTLREKEESRAEWGLSRYWSSFDNEDSEALKDLLRGADLGASASFSWDFRKDERYVQIIQRESLSRRLPEHYSVAKSRWIPFRFRDAHVHRVYRETSGARDTHVLEGWTLVPFLINLALFCAVAVWGEESARHSPLFQDHGRWEAFFAILVTSVAIVVATGVALVGLSWYRWTRREFEEGCRRTHQLASALVFVSLLCQCLGRMAVMAVFVRELRDIRVVWSFAYQWNFCIAASIICMSWLALDVEHWGFFLIFSILVGFQIYGMIFTIVDSPVFILIFFILQILLVLWVRRIRMQSFSVLLKALQIRRLTESLAKDLLPARVLKRCLMGKAAFAVDKLVCGHLFSDVSGFTKLASTMQPEEAFVMVSLLFKVFDEMCEKWAVSKVETVGDAYWCAVGLNGGATGEDMARLVMMGSEMQRVLEYDLAKLGLKEKLAMRIGIHYGPCLGCVVGNKAPRYHLFGSNIEIVQALEQAGNTGGIVLSTAAARKIGKSGEEKGVSALETEQVRDALKSVPGHDGTWTIGEYVAEGAKRRELEELIESVKEPEPTGPWAKLRMRVQHDAQVLPLFIVRRGQPFTTPPLPFTAVVKHESPTPQAHTAQNESPTPRMNDGLPPCPPPKRLALPTMSSIPSPSPPLSVNLPPADHARPFRANRVKLAPLPPSRRAKPPAQSANRVKLAPLPPSRRATPPAQSAEGGSQGGAEVV